MNHISTTTILDEFQDCSNLEDLISLCKKYPNRLILSLSVTIDGILFMPNQTIYLNDHLNFIIER